MVNQCLKCGCFIGKKIHTCVKKFKKGEGYWTGKKNPELSKKLKRKLTWNKGLTKETDNRVLQYSEKRKISMKGQHNSPKSEFKKGSIPWNKYLPRESQPNFQGQTKEDAILKSRIATRVRMALNYFLKTGKIMSARKYGINYKSILEHLKPFPKNKSKYQIDHIRPLCSFNFVNKNRSTNLNEIKKAFAPENHQWLTIKENQIKGGKW